MAVVATADAFSGGGASQVRAYRFATSVQARSVVSTVVGMLCWLQLEGLLRSNGVSVVPSDRWVRGQQHDVVRPVAKQ